MAKKKKGTLRSTYNRARKKKSVGGASRWIAPLRRLFYGACFVVVIVAGVLYAYQTLSAYWAEHRDLIGKSFLPEAKEGKLVLSSPGKEEGKRADAKPDTSGGMPGSSGAEDGFPSGAELPVCLRPVTEQVIRHEGYTVSYNSDYRVANWVAYQLTGQEAKSKRAERSNKFVRDPQVRGASAENGDYTRTGYDRGHLAPAGDMKWSTKAMRESFYLSNITPQKPGLNRGIWKDLEEQCRLWAMDSGAVLVATGPVLSGELKRLGKNRVAIPKRFYKVLCMRWNGRYEAVGFLFDNRDYDDTPLPSLMIPVDSVERVTQIDFFPSLPDEVEAPMEAVVHAEAWSF